MPLYLDIGNFYTKFILPEVSAKNFFLSLVADFPLPGNFNEFGERIYYNPGSDERCLAGWPASLLTDEVLGITIDYRHYETIFSKVLFDCFNDGDNAEVFLTYDFGENAGIVKNIGESYNGKKIIVKSGYIYNDSVETKIIQLVVRPIPGPLCLFEYYLNEIQEFSGKNCSMVIVDMGYTRTKIYIIDKKNGLNKSAIINIGTKNYYDRVNLHLREKNKKINPFLLIEELELNYPVLPVYNEKYNVEKIFQNVSWDINKDLIQSVTKLLRDYYNSSGQWTDVITITGGGSAYIGKLLHAALSEKNYSFKKVIIDKSPRYSVLKGVPLLLNNPLINAAFQD